MNSQIQISVVIPTLNEIEYLPKAIARVRDQGTTSIGTEIIVSDGGSTDGTLETGQTLADRTVQADSGRACQMNAGAAVASGEFLVFLHADTMPPAGFQNDVVKAFDGNDIVVGAFRFQLEQRSLGRRFIEACVASRCRLFSLPFGDQVLFTSRKAFDELGGFSTIPVMEDVDFVRRAQKLGRIELVKRPAITSARCWSKNGVLKTSFVNQATLLAYLIKLPADKIARTRRNWLE